MRLPLTLTLALAAASALAAPPFTPSAAVASSELDGYRGGFTTATGLVVSLGIERIVTVDGQVAAHSELRLGDLGRPDGGAQVVGQLAQLTNGTVVQNTLNDRTIATTTIIHASVDTRGLMQAMHFQTTLANALTAAASNK